MSKPPPATPPQALRNPDARARAEGFRLIAGVDEAGRGPWAGPVVAAAVVLRVSRLCGVRIDDSKRLTRLQRERALHAILAAADVGVGVACSDAIDRHNILRATFQAMQEAVRALLLVPELILVDGPLAPPFGPPCRPIVRGDHVSYAIS